MALGAAPPFEENADPVLLAIMPGLFTEATDRTAIKRWKDGDKVRFLNGLPQKMGGYEEVALSGAVIRGVPRAYKEWRSLDRQNWIAVGTNAKLYVINSSVVYDITPLRRQATLGANPFATTSGSPLVVVTDPVHGAIAGDYVSFSGATAVAGVTVDGEYKVVSVADNSTYTISATNASATTTGGGSAVSALYDINNGGEDTGFAYGWGTCTWSGGTWGTPRGACSTTQRKLRTWGLDNWGEDLMASPSGDAVYWWDRTTGPSSRAQLVETAPLQNRRIIVSPQNRQLICLGATTIDGLADPLTIRVSNNEDFTDFVPVVIGDESSNVYTKRIDAGSEIITGYRTRRSIIVFTDVGVHLMQPDVDTVYDVSQLSEGNSIVGPNAGVEINGMVYWMSPSSFMRFDGVVEELQCDVWSKIFGTATGQGINITQGDKVYCWHNDLFQEVWWHYPSAAATENDRYVAYNYAEKTWTFGALSRTAAGRKSPAYGNKPIAFDSAGAMYKHEFGVDADGSAMPAYVETYDIELGKGKEQMHIGRCVPDNVEIIGDVTVTFKAKRRPEDSAYVSKAYTVASTTKEFGTRSRGRQVAVRFASNALASHWRLGPYTLYVQPDGER